MSEKTVAVLGLGLIGSIWAKHYQTDGLLPTVWNRSPKPDLPFTQSSLEECASQSSFIHLCLYDAESVREVLAQLVPFLGISHTVIQSSTIDGSSATEFAGTVAQTGAAYLEAPFTGSKPAAEERKTVFFLGGDASTVTNAGGILETVSAKRFHIGTPAQAASIKLAMNLQITGITQALCESITMSRHAGIDDDTFFKVMKANVSWSGLSELKEPKLRADDLSTQFSVKNMHKDMRLASQTTEGKMPLLETVLQCLAEAEASGHGEDDFLAIIRNLK